MVRFTFHFKISKNVSLGIGMPNTTLCKCVHCDYELLHDSYKFCPQCGRLVSLIESNRTCDRTNVPENISQPQLSFQDFLKRKSDDRQGKRSQSFNVKPNKKSKKFVEVLVNIGLMYLCGDTLKPVRGNVIVIVL